MNITITEDTTYVVIPFFKWDITIEIDKKVWGKK